MRVAFYDKSDTGHHLEFIRHVVKAAAEYSPLEVHMIVSPMAVSMIEDLCIEGVVTIENERSSSIQEEARKLLSICEERKIGYVFFMNIDPYLKILGKDVFKRANLTLSGIYFHPFHRIRMSSLKAGLQKVKRMYAFRQALANEEIKTLFVLDDKLEDQVGVPRLKYLPDPIGVHLTTEDIALLSKKKERVDILAFGSIIRRKGLENLIKAVSQIDSSMYTLRIVGRGDTSYVGSLLKLVRQAASRSEIIIDSRFVTDKEKDQLFRQADIISMVYRDFYGSSGALGHAVAYGKKVIVSDKGLISRLTLKYDLGVTVDSTVSQLKSAMLQLAAVEGKADMSARKYLSEKTPEAFTEVIFDEIMRYYE